jgi:CelD/BcsL family acetyltransferase involved in cellulose biosynthesis
LQGLTWDEYLQRLGTRTRKNVKRYLHQLEARGGYALETFDRAEDMGRALDLYLDIEGRSWKRPAGQGIGKDARNEGFYRDLLPRLARSGRSAISFLRLRDRHIAALIEHSMNGVVYAAQTAFDDETAALSPGAALQALCLKRRIELGAREYELFAKFLKDKLRWTSHVRPNRDFVVEQHGRLRHKVLLAGRGILRQLRGVGGPAVAGR